MSFLDVTGVVNNNSSNSNLTLRLVLPLPLRPIPGSCTRRSRGSVLLSASWCSRTARFAPAFAANTNTGATASRAATVAYQMLLLFVVVVVFDCQVAKLGYRKESSPRSQASHKQTLGRKINKNKATACQGKYLHSRASVLKRIAGVKRGQNLIQLEIHAQERFYVLERRSWCCTARPPYKPHPWLYSPAGVSGGD